MKILSDSQRRYIDLYGWNISSMRNKWYLRFYVEIGQEQLSIASYDMEDETLRLKYKLPCCVIEMIYARIDRLNDFERERI